MNFGQQSRLGLHPLGHRHDQIMSLLEIEMRHAGLPHDFGCHIVRGHTDLPSEVSTNDGGDQVFHLGG